MTTGTAAEPYAFVPTLRDTMTARIAAFERHAIRDPALRHAAVAIIVAAGEDPAEAAFLLTRRPRHLKRHAGQYALPGGRMDAGETPEAAALRETVGRPDAPILIDQEGGRVARLQPPHWRKYPPGAAYGALVANDPLVAREIWRICGLIRASGISSVIVDKNWKHVTQITDRNLILVKGEVVFEGTTKELLAQPGLLEQHLGV